MKRLRATTALIILASSSNAAWASAVSQREYNRGYADCVAGRFDQDRHGVSYKAGCRAAENKRDAEEAAAQASSETGAAAEAARPAHVARASSQRVEGVTAQDKRACLAAVKKQTQNPKTIVLDAETSEANNAITIGVGSHRAPWRCLVKRGIVAEVMSLSDEGKL